VEIKINRKNIVTFIKNKLIHFKKNTALIKQKILFSKEKCANTLIFMLNHFDSNKSNTSPESLNKPATILLFVKGAL